VVFGIMFGGGFINRSKPDYKRGIWYQGLENLR
jgi:hypothetical protein